MSSHIRFMSSNAQVKSSYPRVKSSNLRVRRLKARAARLKSGIGRLKAWVGRLKVRVRRLKQFQTIAIHILPNISQSKGNPTMKFCQKYNKINIFLQKLCGKWGRKSSSRPLYIFWKSLILGESSLVSIYFDSP